MYSVIPGISEHDQEELIRKIALVVPYAEWVHLDISNDLLVPAPNPALFSFVKKNEPVSFEAHLPALRPESFVKFMGSVGFKRIIAPVECPDPREFISEARVFETEIGLSIDLETELEEVEPFLEELDFVLVLTSGAVSLDQPFEERALSKIKAIRRNLPDFPIEVEGGMDEETVKLAVDAGATRIVSTTHIFKDEAHISQAMERLGATGES